MQTAPPLSHRSLKFTLPHVHSAKLLDGTPVYIIPAMHKDIVSLNIAMRTGSVSDELQGITSFAAQMLNRGTVSMDASTFAEEVERRGCTVRASSDADTTMLRASGLGEWFDDLVSFSAECLLHPRFDETEIDKLRQRIIADIMVELVDVEWLASRACAQRAFHQHPYANPVVGTPATIREFNREHVLAAHKRMYTSERYIVVAGPVDPDYAIAKLNAALAGLPTVSASAVGSPALFDSGYGVMAVKDDAVQTAFRIAMPSIGYEHQSYSALQLATNVLGGYTLARLFTILREEKGYTYGAYAFPTVRPLSATTTIVTSVGNEFTADTMATISEEVHRIKSERIADEEFENARQQILGSFARNCETPQQAAALVHAIVQYRLPFDYFDHHIERLQELTPDSVLDAQEKYFSTNSWVIGVSGVKSVIEPAISPYVKYVEEWTAEGYSA